MDGSILNDVKKQIGIAEANTDFDKDLIININTNIPPSAIKPIPKETGGLLIFFLLVIISFNSITLIWISLLVSIQVKISILF